MVSLPRTADSDGVDLTLLASDSDFPRALVPLWGIRLDSFDGLAKRGEELLALLALSCLVLEDKDKEKGEGE